MNQSLRFIGNLFFIVILFLVLYSFAMFQGGFVSWFLFFSFLPIFLYHLGLLFYPMNRWKVSRTLSHQSIQAGDSIIVTIHMKRFMPFPLYYCIVDDILPHTLQKIDSRHKKYAYLNQPEKLIVDRKIKKITFPWFHRNIELKYELEQIPRGEHNLRVIRLRTGDVFGLIKKECEYEVPDTFLVFPNQRQLRINDQLNRFPHGSVTSYAWHTKNTNVAVGVREYVPGDKYSWIDWKQTAKNNLVMSKEFEREKNTDILFVLDQCQEDHLNLLAFEGAIEFINSLILEIDKESSQVSLLSIGDGNEYFSFLNDTRKLDQVRQYLAKAQPIGKRPFAVQLQEAVTKLNSSYSIVLVIHQIDEPLMTIIQQLKYQSKKIVIFLIQAKMQITFEEQSMLGQLQREGIMIHTITEHELVRKTLEVNL